MLELNLHNQENLEHMDLVIEVVLPPRPVIMDIELVVAAVLVEKDIQDLMDPIKEEVVLVKVDLFSLVVLTLVAVVVELVVMVVKTPEVLVDPAVVEVAEILAVE